MLGCEEFSENKEENERKEKEKEKRKAGRSNYINISKATCSKLLAINKLIII